MKYSDLSSKTRTSYHWINFAAASLLVAALGGCGGGGGGSDTTAAVPVTPTPTPTPTSTVPTVAVPTGTAPITLTAATPAATFAALAPVVAVGGVSINSPPCVAFSMADANGNGIIGFGSTSKRAVDVTATYPNLAFALAKLVPAANGSPSKWVSYIVTRNPTFASATDTTVVPGTPQGPATDNNGTLTDNKNGTYLYCFARDIKTIKDQVAAATFTGNNKLADLGDLTYDPTLVHRLAIQIAGDVPGTNTNTPDGSVGAARVRMTNPLNVIYDFIPATGKAVDPADATIAQRLIIDKKSCEECHAKLGGIPGTESQSFHSGSRYDPKYCVVCHTDQRKYGSANTVSTNFAFPVDSKGVPVQAAVADGVTLGNFPVLIHRVHKGEELVKANYNFGGVLLNETKFPMDIRNCDKCHDNTAPKVAPQATNYQTVPSRLACGACHDGIDFATGTGRNNSHVLATGANNTWGHIGGAQADDSKCALCHDATSIKSVYHIPITPPNAANALVVSGGSAYTNAAWIASNRSNLPPGAISVSYDIKSVSLNASKNPVIVFRMLQNGARADLNTYSATGKTEIWDNFVGAPSLYFVWAVTQDGVAAPADFNANASGWLKSIWNGTATGASAGTLSAPDASGYYTATLTGVTVPSGAVMFSGGMGYTYNLGTTPPLTQTNVAETISSNNTFGEARFGVTSSTIVGGSDNKIGGLIVVTPDAQMVGTGFTARRPIVDDALCNKCHKELGLFTGEAFHAGQRNDGSTCAWCHRPNQTSGGWSADSSYFVHAIHAADKRTKPFTWHAAVVGKSFADIGYPGILNRCETCHLPGTYDFSATASASALPNRLFRTVGTGTFNSTVAGSLNAYINSPYVDATNTVNYGSGPSYSAAAGTITAGAGTTLVISPIMTACVSCHDGVNPATGIDAISHMTQNGGAFYASRASLMVPALSGNLKNNETCLLCHGVNSAFGLGIAAVHK